MNWTPSEKDLNDLNAQRVAVGLSEIPADRIKTSKDWSIFCSEVDAIVEDVQLYLLQNCNAGYLGNSPVFWHKSGSGYTQWIDEAKHWTREEVEKTIRSTKGSHNWRIWPLSDIESVAKRTVDIQDLRKLESV